MIAIHTTTIFLPSESKKSGSFCPKKVPCDHYTDQITLKFQFYAVWMYVNSPKNKKVENSKFHFLAKLGGCPASKEKSGLFVDFEFLTEIGSWGTD